MNDATSEFLKSLESADWFSHVGEPTDEPSVDSWRKAVTASDSRRKENIWLDARGVLTVTLHNEHMERHCQWNDIVDSIKPASQSIADRKVQPLIDAGTVGQSFLDTVRWDLLHACMELEFADLVEPPYYVDWSEWYRRGRVPVDWYGDFPDGRLVIF